MLGIVSIIVGIGILFCILSAASAWTSLTTQRTLQRAIITTPSTKPLTIFLVTNNYTPFSGGVVSAIDSYAQELRALGHRPIIITLGFTSTLEQDNDVLRIWCPIRFLYRTNHIAIPWFATQTLFHAAHQYNPDIIHTYHPFLLGASALKVGNTLNIPVLFSYLTLYDQYTHYIPFFASITKAITRYCVNDFCSKVDAVIVPGKSIAQYIKKQGVTRSLEILPLSILPIFLHASYQPKSLACNARRILVTVSRFTPEKNLYFLLDMVTQLEKNRYTLVLIGYGFLESDLKKYAYETLQLSYDDVVFIIKPTKQELCDWYLKAHIFVFASHTETQGLVLAEAMAAGTPVVALEAPGVQDIVVNGINGFMVHTQKEMITTIASIIHDPILYQALQQNAWRTAQNYCPKKRALQLIKVYTNLRYSSK